MFVDNARKIANPVNMKTPPPPMWGDEETEYDDDGEPFYDPNGDYGRASRENMHLDTK